MLYFLLSLIPLVYLTIIKSKKGNGISDVLYI